VAQVLIWFVLGPRSAALGGVTKQAPHGHVPYSGPKRGHANNVYLHFVYCLFVWWLIVYLTSSTWLDRTFDHYTFTTGASVISGCLELFTSPFPIPKWQVSHIKPSLASFGTY
jgi:hypothetical protein